MPTTFNVISLGQLADMDLVEGDVYADNASALLGLTFGGIGNALADDFVSFSPGATGYDGGVAGTYDQANISNDTFRIDGGPEQVFDSTARFFATLTYIDGTSVAVEVVLFQDTNGNSYIAPDFSANSNQALLEGGAIRSIRLDSVSFNNTDGLVADRQTFNYVACFTLGALIETDAGPRRIESLQPGDLVRTRDHGYQSLRWIGRATREAVGALVPVRIRQGALGCGLPKRDVLVSQQHRMLLNSRIAERLTGAREVLMPAKKLLCVPGVELAEDVSEVTYLHLLFDRHEIIYVEGAPTESLLTGEQALLAIGPEALAEVTELFPELIDSAGHPARIIPDPSQMGRLIYRHWKNQQPMLQG